MSVKARAPVLLVAEPAAAYQSRPLMVVDCSALAGVLFLEPWMDQAVQRLAGHRLFAPHLLQAEICSVAVKKARRGAAQAAVEALAQWSSVDVELIDFDVQQTFALAQRYQLSAYDASYLWLAEQLRCPLATFDTRLGAAAAEHLAGLA
jgi:predicted nucleic acid-binding protein